MTHGGLSTASRSIVGEFIYIVVNHCLKSKQAIFASEQRLCNLLQYFFGQSGEVKRRREVLRTAKRKLLHWFIFLAKLKMGLMALPVLLALYVLIAASVGDVAGLPLTSLQVKQGLLAAPMLKFRATSPLYLTNTSTVSKASQLKSDVGDKTYEQCDDSSSEVANDFLKVSECLLECLPGDTSGICEECCTALLTDVRQACDPHIFMFFTSWENEFSGKTASCRHNKARH